MPAAYWKIRIEQGETWRAVLRLKDEDGPLDLTGYSVRMQIRESLSSPVPLVSLTSGSGGGITVDASEGVITLFLSDDATAAMQWPYGLYDLEIESSGGETTRILKGEVLVSQEVTR